MSDEHEIDPACIDWQDTARSLQQRVTELERERHVSLSMPSADWSGAWAELTGYVRQSAADGVRLDAAHLADYMAELRRGALAPVAEWMAARLAGTESGGGSTS